MPITYYPTFKNSSGNVGIGTISPGFRFDIKATTANSSTTFALRNSNDSYNFIVNDGGTASAGGDFRAPIFYDSNDTGYYLNPASTSNLNSVALIRSGSDGYLTLPGSVTVSNVNGSEIVLRNLNQLRFSTSTSWDWNAWAGLKYDQSTTTIYLGGPAATTIFTANATPPTVTVSFVGTNAVSSNSDFRAPIFYDSNNTAFYIDAAGTSVLSALTVGGNNVLTTASTLTAGNLSGTIPSGVLGNSTLNIGTTAIALNRGSSSQTLTGVSIDGNAATVTNGVYTTGTQTIGGDKTFSNALNLTTGGTSARMLTAYTNLTNNYDWENSPISIRERGLVSNGQSSDIYSPSLNFHWAMRWSASLWMNQNGNLNWGGYSVSGVPSNDGVFRTGDIYVNIIYDKNNSAYYVDPASTSVLNALTIGGNTALTTASTLTAGNLSGTIPSGVLANSTVYVGTTAIALNRGSASQTLTGTSIDGNAATVTNGVYTTGDQSISGVKTFANKIVFNSAIANRPQFPGGILGLDTGDGNFDIWGISRDYYPSHATAANAWGLRWNGDNNDFQFVGGGTNRVVLDMDSGDITATGIITSSADVRAPIFYDSNNTAYYIDAASTSNLNALIVAASTRIGGAASRSTSGLTVGFTDNSTFAANTDVGDTDRMLSIVNESSTTNAMAVLGFRVNPNGGTTNAMLDMKYVQTGATNTSGLHYTFNHGGSFLDRFSILSSGNVGIGAIAPDTNLQVVGHVHVGNQTTFENTGGWNKTIYLDGAVHARMRILGSAFASGKNSATETSIWVDNSVAPYSGLDTNAGSFRINAGFTTMLNSARSPIFYDSDDTNFYIDAASTSVLNALSLTTLNNIRAAANVWHTSSDGTRRFYFASSGITYYSTGSSFVFRNSSDIGVVTIDSVGNLRTSTSGDNFASFSLHVGGTGFASADFRTPIFYDSDDTAYYINAASFSLISSMGIGGLTSSNNVQMYDSYVDASSSYLQSPPLIIRKDSSATGAIDQAPVGLFIYNLNGTNNTWTKLSMGSREAAGAGNTVSIAGLAAQKTAGTANAWATGNLHFWTKAGATQITNMIAYSSGYVESAYSFRAPIFYDSNNTSYYIDAASGSSLNTLTMAGTITGALDATASFIGGVCTAASYNYVLGGANDTGNKLVIFVNGSTRTADGGVNALTIRNDGGAFILGQASYLTSILGSSVTINSNVALHAGNYNSYAPTLTGTGASGSWGISVTGNAATATILQTARNINGTSFNGSAAITTATWGTARTITIGSTGKSVDGSANVSWSLAELGAAATNQTMFIGTTSVAINRSSASQTLNGVSIDGNSATTTLATKATRANGNFYIDDNYGNTVVGLYSATRLQGVFAMGDSYKLTADGTGVGTLYGLAWSHPNFGGVAANLADHGLLILQNGVFKGAWGGGSFRTPSDIRGTLFYDWDNTGYYCDPASTSNLNAVTAAGNITAAQYYTGGWFRNNSSGNGLYNESSGQHFYSDDVSYWNVASSSTVQGIRLRTGGYNGTIRGYFYADNANDVGLLNNAGNWRIRIVGGDYTLFDGSSIRAQIFYDSNNTAYYIDAASTSILNGLNVVDANLELYKSQTVDMSNTTTYSTSNYYPVTIEVPTEGCIIQIQNNLNSNVPSWATHGSGFTLNLKWRTNGSGWGTTAVRRIIDQYFEQFTNQTICGGITQMTNSSTEVVWLRGGGQYLFKFSRNLSATAQTTTYTVNSQSVTPTSAVQNNIWNSWSGGWTLWNNITISDTQMQSPIYYDYNNTAYYVDAASTSNLVGLTVVNTITGSVSGNAGTATTLQTARNINGTSFNGSAAITTATWGTARTITIGSTGKSVDGSANVSWSLAELGAAATNQTMFIGTTSVAINRASASQTLTGISIDGSAASCTGNAATVTNGVYTTGDQTISGIKYFTSTVDPSTVPAGYAGGYILESTTGFGTYGIIFGSATGQHGAIGYSSNTMYFGTENGTDNTLNTKATLSSGGTFTANADVRSPIFYDSNNTGYYLQPNSTSNLLLVRTRNTFGERVAVSATASTTINTQYNVTELTLAATITTLTLSNIQASGIVHMWTIVTVGGGVGYSITWPAAVKWPGGTAPTLTTASSKRDIYQFVTYDGGTNIYAIIVGQNL